eukprot:1969767-Pleurochrysis_carterae.AAC.1
MHAGIEEHEARRILRVAGERRATRRASTGGQLGDAGERRATRRASYAGGQGQSRRSRAQSAAPREGHTAQRTQRQTQTGGAGGVKKKFAGAGCGRR